MSSARSLQSVRVTSLCKEPRASTEPLTYRWVRIFSCQLHRPYLWRRDHRDLIGFTFPVHSQSLRRSTECRLCPLPRPSLPFTLVARWPHWHNYDNSDKQNTHDPVWCCHSDSHAGGAEWSAGPWWMLAWFWGGLQGLGAVSARPDLGLAFSCEELGLVACDWMSAVDIFVPAPVWRRPRFSRTSWDTPLFWSIDFHCIGHIWQQARGGKGSFILVQPYIYIYIYDVENELCTTTNCKKQ